MGYSETMVEYRQNMWEKACQGGDGNAGQRFGATFYVFGSKGEGVASFLEDDVDHMVEIENILCVEDARPYRSTNINLFVIDKQFTAPGYARLRFANNTDNRLETIYERSQQQSSSLDGNDKNKRANDDLRTKIDRNLVKYLSNSFFANEMEDQLKNLYQYYEHWLSNRREFNCGTDVVLSIRCQCPNIASQWIERRRNHDWPPQETVKQMSALGAHAVPVGSNLSSEPSIEWRISFTRAELKLAHALSITQLKAYVLLRLVAKHILQPISPSMTSYAMKNVVFWVCESSSDDLFTENKLLDVLVSCLRKLREFIQQGTIPCYMIPERNLLRESHAFGQRNRLVSVLTDLIEGGNKLVLRCDSLRQAMFKTYREPEKAKRESDERDAREREAFRRFLACQPQEKR